MFNRKNLTSLNSRSFDYCVLILKTQISPLAAIWTDTVKYHSWLVMYWFQEFWSGSSVFTFTVLKLTSICSRCIAQPKRRQHTWNSSLVFPNLTKCNSKLLKGRTSNVSSKWPHKWCAHASLLYVTIRVVIKLFLFAEFLHWLTQTGSHDNLAEFYFLCVCRAPRHRFIWWA